MTVEALQVVVHSVGILQSNATIIHYPVEGFTVVCDPGEYAEKLIDTLEEFHAPVSAIFLTHAHIDHIGALHEVTEFSKKLNHRLGALDPLKIYLHPKEEDIYRNVGVQARMFNMNPFPVPEKVYHYRGKDSFHEIPDATSAETPGHSPGSCILKIDRPCEVTAFIDGTMKEFNSDALRVAGDTLFQGSVGRTDIWGGSATQLRESLDREIKTLDQDYLVVTGHGPVTTLKEELSSNPFLR